MNTLLANRRVAFTYIKENILRRMFISFIRPTLDYTAVVWNLHLEKHLKMIEKYKGLLRDGLPATEI